MSRGAGGVQGRLRLGFSWDAAAGRTRLSAREHSPPLQVVRAFDQPDGAALVHLHNVSGGVLGGDRLDTSVHVGPRARAQLTTTGATRLYRSRAGECPAHQRTEIYVAENGLLEWLPDPVIPFAGSRSRQETRITLTEGAGLFWWETVAPGRVAYGESFAYDLWENDLTLWANGQPIARERIRLEPSVRPLPSLARLGPYRHWTTFYACKVGEPAVRWAELEADLAAEAETRSRPGETVWGVSTLPAHGLSVRGLSVRGLDLTPGLLAFWRAAKRALHGREAIPPRKIY